MLTFFFTDDTMVIQKITFITSSLIFICMAILSIFTEAKINFLPFKLCSVIFIISACSIITGLLV